MEPRILDPMTIYVLVGGMLVIFIGLALRHFESLQRGVPLWLWAGLAGLLLGAGATGFAVHKVEAKQTASYSVPTADHVDGMQGMGGPDGGGRRGGGQGGGGGLTGTPPGPSMGGMGGGGGGGGMGGGMGGPGGGGQGGQGAAAPRSRRDLSNLIGKLDLLTRGLHLNLADEQKSKLIEAIAALDQEDEMTEDAAKKHLDEINAILNSENSELLATIELPRPARGAGGAAGGGGTSRGGDSATPKVAASADGARTTASGSLAVMPIGSGGAPIMGGGGQPASDENPFKQQDNAARLSRLRERIGAPASEPNSESQSQ